MRGGLATWGHHVEVCSFRYFCVLLIEFSVAECGHSCLPRWTESGEAGHHSLKMPDKRVFSGFCIGVGFRFRS